MTLVSPRLVTSGYFRNNLYVLLGLNVLATLIAFTGVEIGSLATWPPMVAAITSYTGSVAWLYDKITLGRAKLAIIAAVSLVGAWLDNPAILTDNASTIVRALDILTPVTSGAVLGSTMAAMLLGHWYLNSPGMKIAPLERLLLVMLGALAAQTVLSAIGLVLSREAVAAFTPGQLALLGLRWLAGLAGAAVMAVMARQTLKIPNTQSATGILYVAVMFTFLGELAALLLSTDTSLPL